MATLRTQPESSTARQRQVLHQLKRRHGWTDDELHHAIGADSTTRLSASQASECIRRLGGGKLANPPGQKPAPYAGRRKTTDATRMITPDHEEQIERTLCEHFGDLPTGLAWLARDFDAKQPRDLLTAKRAGQVIRVLKDMLSRRDAASDFEPIDGRQDAVRSVSEPCSDDI